MAALLKSLPSSTFEGGHYEVLDPHYAMPKASAGREERAHLRDRSRSLGGARGRQSKIFPSSKEVVWELVLYAM